MIPLAWLIPNPCEFWLGVLRGYLVVGGIVYAVAFIVISKQLKDQERSNESKQYLPLKVLLSYTALVFLILFFGLPFLIHGNLP
jgi:hypothetical protein